MILVKNNNIYHINYTYFLTRTHPVCELLLGGSNCRVLSPDAVTQQVKGGNETDREEQTTKQKTCY